MKPLYDYNPEYVMTAGELRKMLGDVSDNAPVFVLLDISDTNYDEESGLYRVVHPVDHCESEEIPPEPDFHDDDDNDEENVIIHLCEDFYYTYECKPK